MASSKKFLQIFPIIEKRMFSIIDLILEISLLNQALYFLDKFYINQILVLSFMSFLYSLSNILVPVCLLTHQSFSKFASSSEVPYGKWALMVILIYLFNLVNWIWDDSYLFMFIDFTVKILVPFLPESINKIIEEKISNLHLEIWLDQVRCWAISAMHRVYWRATEYLLGKMEFAESQQFKQGLMRKLAGLNENQTENYSIKPAKHFQNSGVNCLLLTPEIVENISNTAKKLQEFTKKVTNQKSHLHNQTFGQIKPTKQVSSQKKKQELPKFNYKKQSADKKPPSKIAFKPALSLNLRESQHQIDFEEQQGRFQPLTSGPISPNYSKAEVGQKVSFKTAKIYSHSKQQSKPSSITKHSQEFKRTYTFTDNTSSQLSTHPQQYKKPYREDGEQASKQLLDKLDLSASDYSDMFDEDQQLEEDMKMLQCKVQVILEIGVGSSARLEIYNVELYSNRDLRIVSLYNREFEKHKLREIKKLPNSYYELIFDQGKIQSRNCKFRGQYQPFLKYLSQ